jgi:transcriptional regulator of heat shock response
MISTRQEALLASIIEEFIKTAEPISSKLLEESGSFSLSSATIRAEMNELEGLGYLAHLHTSSGRVPTDRAYRFFVDNCVSGSDMNPDRRQQEKIRKTIRTAGSDPRDINRAIAQTLSDLSDNLVITGIVEEDDFYKIGLANLFELPEFREFGRAFRLASFFEEFEGLFEQIEKDFFGEIGVFIGRENQVKDIRDETIMFAKYDLPHNHTGSITLVGPTRMDYAKNIGLIKCATEELNKLSKEV